MTAATDIDWMVISLERTPERLEEFRANNGGIGLPIEVLPAVDGKLLDREELVRDGMIVSVDFKWAAGAIGATMSHRLCWLRAVETGRPVVVFEDDVVLRQDFAEKALELIDTVPADWDIIQFGINTDSLLDVELLPGVNSRGWFSLRYPQAGDCRRFAASGGEVVPARFHNAFGAAAYAISPKGAQNFLDRVFPMSLETTPIPTFKAQFTPFSGDGAMNRYYRQLKSYISLPFIALPINDHSTSTIWQKKPDA